MLGLAIVPILEADKIALARHGDAQAGVAVQATNERRIFDDKQKARRTLAQEIRGQPLMIGGSEFVTRVGAELAVIRWIEEEKILRRGRVCAQKFGEVEAGKRGRAEQAAHLQRAQMSDFASETFAVVGDAAVRDIERAAPVVTEHRGVGVFTDEVKQRR